MAKTENERSGSGKQDRAQRVRNKLRDGSGHSSANKNFASRIIEVMKSPAGKLWILNLAFSFLLSLLILYPDSITQSEVSYNVGDIAREDIRAPKDFPVVDADATEIKKSEAREAVIDVYDFDTTAKNTTIENLDKVFVQFRELYAGLEAKKLLAPRDGVSTALRFPRGRGANVITREEFDLIVKETTEKEAEYRELLPKNIDDKTFEALKVDRFSESSSNAIVTLITPPFDSGIVGSPELLKQQLGKGIAVRLLPLPVVPEQPDGDEASEKKLPAQKIQKDISEIIGVENARLMVKAAAETRLKEMPFAIRRAISSTAQAMLQVNLTFNKSETELQKTAAEAATNAIFFQVKQGEIITREGDRITKDTLQRITALDEVVEPPKSWLVVLGTVIIISLIIAVVYTFANRGIRKFSPSFKDVAVMASVGAILLALFKITMVATTSDTHPTGGPLDPLVFLVPMAAGAMLIRLLLNFETATIFTVIFSPIVGYMAGGDPFITMYIAIISFLAAGEVAHCKQRTTLLRAGLVVGLASVIILMARALIADTFFDMGTQAILPLGYGMLGGLATGILVLALTPILESTLSYSTDIKLLELSSHENTLLKELIYRAPGTYQHSIMVGTLAEAAAESINVNPLLARVMALYHDVGKMINPQYFAENQRDGKNPHTKLSPSLSNRVIISHVKDGIEMARQHKLPEIVIEGIPGHHGTRLIKYFYEKAIQDDESINEADFRYPGPKPRTREAGIMMLADSVEAASRSLKDPNPARIRQVVSTMITTIFVDGQLDDCELTLRDLNNISEAFFRVLSNVYHQRPEYPGTPFASTAVDAESSGETSGETSGESSGENSGEKNVKTPRGAGGPGVRPEEPPGVFQETFTNDGPDDAESPRVWKH